MTPCSYFMLAALSKLALRHKLERGMADSNDAWAAAKSMLNCDPCDDWPVTNIGGVAYVRQNDIMNGFEAVGGRCTPLYAGA